MPIVWPNSGAKPVVTTFTSWIITSDIGSSRRPARSFLGVRVAVDLVVDAHRGAVGGKARHAEFDVLDAGHTGLHEREVVGIARDQRQVVDLEIGHRVTDIDASDVERRRIVAADGDRLADRADRQRRVHDRGLANRQLDVGAFELLEALELRARPCSCRAAVAARGTTLFRW